MSRITQIAAALARRREVALLVLIVVVATLVGIYDPGFLSAANGQDIAVRCAPTAIVACGVMLVVVTGEIDISAGSLMALVAAALGTMLSQHERQWPLWIGIPLTLLLGTAVGTTTGFLVTIGRVPSIITTLGMLTALRGLTTWLMGGKNIEGLPVRLSVSCKTGLFGLPLSIWVATLVIGMTAIIIWQTPLGRRLFAIGSSPHSAQLAGLSERKLKLFAFAYTGFLTAVATIVDVPRLPKIEAGIGVEFELLVVTCVVVGGVAISGGRGRLLGVMLAVVLMTMIRPVLTFLAIGESGEKWTKAIQGLFIILAVVSDRLWSRSSGEDRFR